MKRIFIKMETLLAIQNNGEDSYPKEGAGLIFGIEKDGVKTVLDIFPIRNAQDEASQHNRYLITPRDMMKGEIEADKLGFDVIGVFHSHPDHPDQPSKFDQDWALPWYSYIISSVMNGDHCSSRSWKLKEDRTGFLEESIEIIK